MPRRALLATMITAAIGALMGVVFGALVGRVIALFGDETVQTSVPMIFCATLGYFVGGASTIKGSLERFGAPRAPIATFVATVILIVLVGGVSVSAKAGVLVVITALIALVLASVAAVAIGRPSNTPKHGINAPRVTGAEKRAAAVESVASVPSPAPSAPVEERPRAASAARRVSTEPPPRPKPLVPPIDEVQDWVPEDEPSPAPPEEATTARPRRDRPLRRDDAASEARPVKKTPPAKRATPATAPAPKKAAVKKAAVKKAAKKAVAKTPAAKTAPAKKATPPSRRTKER